VGTPFLVTVTRSCVSWTLSTTALKCAFTDARDWVLMTSILVTMRMRGNGVADCLIKPV
jgi:hypothetical protein